MYTENSTHTNFYSRPSLEIDLEVREMERRMAIMGLGYRDYAAGGFAQSLRKAAKRVATFIAALF